MLMGRDGIVTDRGMIMARLSQICRLAWMLIHDVSEGRMLKMQAYVKQGLSGNTGRLPCGPRQMRKTYSARAWLDEYFSDENGRLEKLPNPRYGREEHNLPTWAKKSLIYDEYKKWAHDQNGTVRKPTLTHDY